MKPFQIVFSVLYIGSLFFCIFARIESWPFSDYGVFQNANYPKNISVRVPYFKLSNGEYFDPFKKRYFGFDREYFDQAIHELKPDELDSYLKKLIKSKAVKKVKHKMIAENLTPVKFVVMKVTFKETKKNLYKPVYTPEKEYDLH